MKRPSLWSSKRSPCMVPRADRPRGRRRSSTKTSFESWNPESRWRFTSEVSAGAGGRKMPAAPTYFRRLTGEALPATPWALVGACSDPPPPVQARVRRRSRRAPSPGGRREDSYVRPDSLRHDPAPGPPTNPCQTRSWPSRQQQAFLQARRWRRANRFSCAPGSFAILKNLPQLWSPLPEGILVESTDQVPWSGAEEAPMPGRFLERVIRTRRGWPRRRSPCRVVDSLLCQVAGAHGSGLTHESAGA